MGYLVFSAVIVVCALFAGFLLMARTPRPRRGTLESDHPVSREEPAADEPTPAASATHPPSRQRAAERHTPPA